MRRVVDQLSAHGHSACLPTCQLVGGHIGIPIRWDDIGGLGVPGCDSRPVRPYEELVGEAAAADVSGWGFGWLDGRATEERPPWGYARMLAARLAEVESALDVDTGGGEVVGEAAVLPPRTAATEAWLRNAAHAYRRLGPRGVGVVAATADRLPFRGATFDLVTSRHPVRPCWPEIHRVLRPGGRYLAQHVGPSSAFELIEYFLGPLPRGRQERDPALAVEAALAAGLTVVDLREARCRMEIRDVGAVVYLLRKCVWWVPDFTVERYADTLGRLDAQLRTDGPFVAYSTRYLIEAVRPDR
jgi:SAM-dependent methyltransferase